MSSQRCRNLCRAEISKARWSGDVIYKQDGRIDPNDLTNRLFRDRTFFAKRSWSPPFLLIVELLLGSYFFAPLHLLSLACTYMLLLTPSINHNS